MWGLGWVDLVCYGFFVEGFCWCWWFFFMGGIAMGMDGCMIGMFADARCV